VIARRPTTVVGVAVSVLALVAIVVLVFAVGRDVSTFDEGTPEWTVQQYLTAAFDGDTDRAASFIEPAGECDADDLDRAYIQDNARIGLVESVVDGDRARVRVDVEFPSGGPLGGVYSEEHTLRLVRSAGSWLLTGVPWPLFDCTMSDK
jgi:hypothetical protein